MAWPSITSAQTNIGGVTTIRWGTGGIWPQNSAAIVISADAAEEAEKIYIEQGEGLKATRITLKQGRTWDFTVVDDSAVFASPPAVGSMITVVNFLANNTNAASQAVVIDNNYRAARKQEGHRVIRAEIITLIDGSV